MVSKSSCTIDRGVPANDRSVSWVSKKILVATDLSPGADLAVRRAVMLGKRHGASVTLAHVVDEKASQRLIDEEASLARRLLEDWYGPPPANVRNSSWKFVSRRARRPRSLPRPMP